VKLRSLEQRFHHQRHLKRTGVTVPPTFLRIKTFFEDVTPPLGLKNLKLKGEAAKQKYFRFL
jgi:hypothetical protein